MVVVSSHSRRKVSFKAVRYALAVLVALVLILQLSLLLPSSFQTTTTVGTFHGAPVQLVRNQRLQSHLHCVGDNYQPDAWKQRSCRFSNLCFNLTSHDFVLFAGPRESYQSQVLGSEPLRHVSTLLQPLNVSLGGLNRKWGEAGMERLRWFPRIVPSISVAYTYYALPDDTILFPFHSMNGANPGHLVWDDFLPMYALQTMFQLVDHYRLLPLRYILHDGQRGLWASCDVRAERTEECHKVLHKFERLMLKDDDYTIGTTQDDAALQLYDTLPPQSDLVCSKIGLAGIASVNDHGVQKSHGWEEEDYLTTHNHGRGGFLYDFRNHMLENLGVSTVPLSPKDPIRIVFSEGSSDIPNRNVNLTQQIEHVTQAFPNVSVERYVLKTLSIVEQVELAARTSIFISICGGGAVTGMFLPKGASVILYFNEVGGVKNNKRTYQPALLDWDIFNAMSHLRVHWLVRTTLLCCYTVFDTSSLLYHDDSPRATCATRASWMH